eukprot:CAMPEP_0114977718 /NCGR_PEP_ID=MMETSP0216-20121206/3395_1 /TAXON_ID=223996 /ORGANISM="Protocruzia adherens, Strain Boccale" /LENGTH=104 /DNA_ID=CAMNT_0002338811 /DNA_START=321 /DNA_END=631 /DNA_ORIENTATION=+
MVGCYYPTTSADYQKYPDVPLMINGEDDVRGLGVLMKLPAKAFRWISGYGCGVMNGAPVIKTAREKGEKFIPVVFSHGNGMSRVLHSNICRSMASSSTKVVVFS